MNRIVTVPNWSFNNPALSSQVIHFLKTKAVKVHYCRGDFDHQRTVTAFSGPQDAVFKSTLSLAELLLPYIDLSIQKGVHPRVGALDVCPFVLLEGNEETLITACRNWARDFSSCFNIPTYLYEKAAFPDQEFRLPYLRGQMGGGQREPDFGHDAHQKWGTTIVGVRDFLLATNIDLGSADVSIAKKLASRIRAEREKENPKFRGVRALGFTLESRNLTQLSLNLTQPDHTRFDDVFEFVSSLLPEHGVDIVGTELIGVIRERDLSRATHLKIDPDQVVV